MEDTRLTKDRQDSRWEDGPNIQQVLDRRRIEWSEYRVRHRVCFEERQEPWTRRVLHYTRNYTTNVLYEKERGTYKYT